MRPIVFGALLLLAVVSASASSAALFTVDLVAGSGDGLLTVDSATGLEWLDVTTTVGQAYSAVESGPFVGSLGFRFASAAEVEGLWINAGAEGTFTNDSSSNVSVLNYDAAILLLDLMGCSQLVGCDGVGQTWHIAMYGPSSHNVSAALIAASLPPTSDAAMWLDFGQTVDFPRRADVGSYLVRAVPEAAASTMLALGVLGLMAYRFAAAVVR